MARKISVQLTTEQANYIVNLATAEYNEVEKLSKDPTCAVLHARLKQQMVLLDEIIEAMP